MRVGYVTLRDSSRHSSPRVGSSTKRDFSPKLDAAALTALNATIDRGYSCDPLISIFFYNGRSVA